MARKGRAGRRRRSAIQQPRRSDTERGAKCQSMAMMTTDGLKSNGGERDQQDIPAHGAALPLGAPSEDKSEGDSLELKSNPDVPLAAVNAIFEISACAGSQPTHPCGLKRTVSAPGSCRAHQHKCIPEDDGGESWIMHIPKYAARTVLTALKITSAGIKLLLRAAWATATQLFRMATAPLRWIFWRHAAGHNSSSGSASTGAEINSVVAAIVQDSSQTTNHSQPLEAVEPAQPLLRARSAPPMPAHQPESAVPMPSSPVASGPVPSSPVPSSPMPSSLAPAPAVLPQLVVDLVDSTGAVLLESALSAPASPLPILSVQPQPAADLDVCLMPGELPMGCPVAAAAAAVQLKSAAALPQSAVSMPASPLPVPFALPQPAVNLDGNHVPAELAIATEAITAPATVEVQPSAAALLESALPVPVSPQPMPAVPALVPSMPLAVRKHSGKCTKCNARSAYMAKGAFGTSLCWYHMDTEAPEEGLSDTCAPGQDTGRDRRPRRRTRAECPLHLPQRAIRAPAGAVPRQQSASCARRDSGAYARRDGGAYARQDKGAFNNQSREQSWRLFRTSVPASFL